MKDRESSRNPFDLRDIPNPYPNFIPNACNAYEAEAIIEGNALLRGVDLKEAQRLVREEEQRLSGKPWWSG